MGLDDARTYCRIPGWGVRNVKFNSGIGGKEVMTLFEVRPHRSSYPGVEI